MSWLKAGNFFKYLCMFGCATLLGQILQISMPAQAEGCPDTGYEAIQAYTYLNHFRAEPQTYAKRIGLDLGYTSSAPQLRWNGQLAAIARKVAERMAQGNYFAHRDPDGRGPNQRVTSAGYNLPSYYPRDPEANNLESLAAGAPNGIEAINQLVLDAGVSPPDHRVQMLALDSFYQEHSEVGIGVACVPQSEYKYYYVVLTAPKALDHKVAGALDESTYH
ncbi:MAG: CAP domain-containing protein [Gloeobacterales cyanobacterium]